MGEPQILKDDSLAARVEDGVMVMVNDLGERVTMNAEVDVRGSCCVGCARFAATSFSEVLGLNGGSPNYVARKTICLQKKMS